MMGFIDDLTAKEVYAIYRSHVLRNTHNQNFNRGTDEEYYDRLSKIKGNWNVKSPKENFNLLQLIAENEVVKDIFIYLIIVKFDQIKGNSALIDQNGKCRDNVYFYEYDDINNKQHQYTVIYNKHLRTDKTYYSYNRKLKLGVKDIEEIKTAYGDMEFVIKDQVLEPNMNNKLEDINYVRSVRSALSS